MTARKRKRKRRWLRRIAWGTWLLALMIVLLIGISTQRWICTNTAAGRTVTRIYVPFWRRPPPWYRRPRPWRGYALVVWQRVEEHDSAVESFLHRHKFETVSPQHEWRMISHYHRTIYGLGIRHYGCYPQHVFTLLFGPFRDDPEDVERYLEAQQAADPNFVNELYQHMQDPRTTEGREWRRMHRDKYREWSVDLEGSDTPSSDPVPG